MHGLRSSGFSILRSASVLVAGLLASVASAPILAAPPEYELKAAFIARFTEFIDWPPATGNAPFDICVLGAHPIEEPLAKLPALMKAKTRPLRVRRIETAEAAADCEIVFVPRQEAGRMRDVQRAVEKRPVLTVGDTPGLLAQGVLLNFYNQGERLRFEIHLRAAEESGLRFSSRLLKLATVAD